MTNAIMANEIVTRGRVSVLRPRIGTQPWYSMHAQSRQPRSDGQQCPPEGHVTFSLVARNSGKGRG